MNVGRLTLRAAAALKLRLRIICTFCGRVHVSDVGSLSRDGRGETRLGELRLTCSQCYRQEAEIGIEQPDLFVPADTAGLHFTVEEWSADDQHVLELIAASRNAIVAAAAFEAAVEVAPQKRILLRQRCFLMKRHEPEEGNDRAP